MRSRFSTQEVAELTGASVRQVDYWARTGLIKPSEQDAAGRGSRRRYGFRDVVALQTVQKLREGNCPLQTIRTAIKYLKAHYPNRSAPNTDVLARLILLTDGSRVYVLSDEREVMEVVTKQVMWAVPLGRLILDTESRVKAMPTQWTHRVLVRGKPYHLDVTRDDETGEFAVQCRQLPGAIEQGRTLTEAIAHGTDAVESVLDFLDRRRRSNARVQAL